MTCQIEKLDHENSAIRNRIFEFLAEYEPHALFILGNLTMNFPQSHLYAAVKDGRWLGIAGYYDFGKSFIPFSTDADVTRALTRYVDAVHTKIEYVNGIDYAAEPAYEELLRMGYSPGNNPNQVFMEMAGIPVLQQHESCARQIREEDCAEIAHLHRCLRETWDETRPLTAEELKRARTNSLCTAVQADGRIVAAASSNGLGIRCYQILGVATHPAYRRRGYARSAVAALMRIMAGLGGCHAVLFTAQDNAAAQQCYLGLGFKNTGRFYIAKLEAK
jgi:ribosomal protein S18 acetylase RimI-like enzyme